MKRADLERLKAIADMKRESDLQDLARISWQMSALQTDIDRIRRRADERAANLELDSARLSGADVRWHQFSEQQVRSLQQRRAGLAAAREAYLAVARKSFGRAQVVGKLVEARSDRGAARIKRPDD